jgi:imidazolonepropionase-like amidohydrolase
MASTHLLVKANASVLSPTHDNTPAQILVDKSTGKIVDVALGNAELATAIPENVEIIELKDNQLLVPGLVDAHGKLLLSYSFLPYQKNEDPSICDFKDRSAIHSNHLYHEQKP